MLNKIKNLENKIHNLRAYYEKMYNHIKFSFPDNIQLAMVSLSVRDMMDNKFQLMDVCDIEDERYLFFLVDNKPVYAVLQKDAVTLYEYFLRSDFDTLDTTKKEFLYRLNNIISMMTFNYEHLQNESDEVLSHLVTFLKSSDNIKK